MKRTAFPTRTAATLVILLALVAGAPPRPIARADEPNAWPALRTDRDKARFLLWVRQTLPNLFEGMTEYDIDYFDVLDRQDRINAELAAAHGAQLASRPDRKEVTFEVFRPGQADRSGAAASAPEAKIADAAALARLDASARDALASLPTDGRTLAGLRRSIADEESAQEGRNLKSMLALLIKCLPPERRKEAFAAPPERATELLGAGLSREALESGLKPGTREALAIREPADAVRALRERAARDRRLEGLYALAALASREGGDAGAAAVGAVLPGHLGPAEIAKLDRKETLGRALAPNSIARAADLLGAPVKAIVGAGAGVPEAPLARHTLTEVPTSIGWASSCPGGDCFTKNMAAYANVPTTRKFFFDLGPEGARGVFDVQVVEAYEKRYLLVHTVQGRMNPDTMEQALRALHGARRELGAEGFMLPTWDQLGAQTNYNALRDRLRSFVAGRPETHYVFLDNPLRDALAPYVADSGYYTQPSRNRAVVVDFDELPSAAFEVRAKVAPAPAFPWRDVEISRGEALLLAFEIDRTARKPEVAGRLLDALAVRRAEYAAVLPTLGNEARLPTREYLASVAATLAERGYPFDATLKRDRLNALYAGLLRCPDAWSPEWASKSLRASLDLLEKSGTYPLVAESLRAAGANKPDLARMAATYASLLEKLEGKYLERRAAAGILVGFGRDFDRALPPLFGLARESTGPGGRIPVDGSVLDIFREARRADPAAYDAALIAGLRSEHDWIQRGALIAVETTGAGDRVAEAVSALQHGVARSHDAYLHSLRVSARLRAAPPPCARRFAARGITPSPEMR